MSVTSVNLKDPIDDSTCLGGVYSDCGHSPVTNVSVFSGSVENQVFFVLNSGNSDWTNSPVTNRSAVSIDGSIHCCGVAVDGSVIACALSPSDEGSELHVIRPPTEPSSNSSLVPTIKIWESQLFPIRSLCFGLNGKLKTKIFLGTDEGKIFQVSISSKGKTGEISPSNPHGGVKCVRTCPLTGNVAASFCDGYVVLFDSTGKEMESKKIAKKNMTPDSIEKFYIDWSPKPKERTLAIAGQGKPVLLKSGVWNTTPVPESSGDMADGILSVVKWNLDGTMVGGITNAGVVLVWEYSAVTGCELRIRALSATNTLVNFFWSYSIDSHVLNGIGLKGVRTAITSQDCSFLKKELKIDLASLVSSSKEAAVGNMESGLVEEEVVVQNETESPGNMQQDDEKEVDDDDSSSSSSSSSSEAESVDESPEQLAEELNDLLDDGEPKKEGETGDTAMEEEDGEDTEEKNRQDRFNNRDDYRNKGSSMMSVDKQFTFQPGATMSSKAGRRGISRKILCWNQYGSVVRTDFPSGEEKAAGTNEEGLIEVHLESETAPLKQFRLKDNLHGWTVASLGVSGLGLAVKSRFDITDKYEDDLIEDEASEEAKKKKREIDELTGGLSKICYRPFTSWGNQREWIVPLPLRAEVEAIAVGSNCVAAIATDGAIRVWSNEGGFLLSTWNMKANVPISISGNGDMFFVVSCAKSRSTESIMYETFLTQNAGGKITLIDDGILPISATPGTALCWTGVSEDFVPFTCDTQGIIRGLFPFNSNCGSDGVGGDINKFLWVPLLNFVTDYQRRGEGYWPVFISERDIWCVATRAEDDYEPRPAPLPPVLNVTLRPQGQYVADRNEPISVETQLYMDRLVAAQTRFCAQLGLPASAFRTAVDGDLEKVSKKLENVHDKKLADSFRKLVEANKLEKALGSAALAFQSMTSRLMIRMAAALGLRALESRLEELFNPFSAAPVASVAPMQQSAASTLFPQAGGSTVRQATQQSSTVMKPAAANDTPINASPPTVPSPTEQPKTAKINPFAKKRMNDENSANGANKLARNA